jgi:hypothetical protein
MPDSFTELVAKACAEVMATADISGKIALTDRVTAESISAEIAGSAEAIQELRAQVVQQMDRLRDLESMRSQVLTRLLPREWRELVTAQNHFATFSSMDVEAAPARGVLRVFAWRRQPVIWSASKLASEREYVNAALTNAQRAFDTAAGSEAVLRNSLVVDLDQQMTEARSALRNELVKALAFRVNTIIDGALAETYEREFSYSGAAWLADQPGAGNGQVSGELNREASRAISDMIDRGITGAVGVAGPRGIGKTTLLSRFAVPIFDGPVSADGLAGMPVSGAMSVGGPRTPGTRQLRWGVCVSAPAKYEARDFLLHLFGQLCLSALGERRSRELEDEMTGTRPGLASGGGGIHAWLAAYAGVTAVACLGLVIGLLTAKPVASGWAMTDLLIAGCCAVAVITAIVLPFDLLRDMALLLELFQLQLISGYLRGGLPISAVALMEPGSNIIGAALVRQLLYRLAAPLWMLAASFVCAAVLFGLVTAGSPPNPGYVAAAGLAAVTVGCYLLIKWLREEIPEETVPFWQREQVSAARDWYRKVKFQQSYTSGWSGTVTLSQSALPVQAQVGRSGSRTLTPTAMSVPEIVAGFRAFTDTLSASDTSRKDAPPVPVVIGIDEVDKIEDPKTAQDFFNQIKGLFGDTQCLFLISISDDAMAAYERRGLPLRDAFDSSLSTVITLSYMSRREARTLIGSRLVQVTSPSADLLYVLSGGLPREVVRLIRRAVVLQRTYTDGSTASPGASGTGSAPAHGTVGAANGRVNTAAVPAGPVKGAAEEGAPEQKLVPVPLDALAATLIADQVAAQRRAVLIRGRMLEPCEARDGLLAWASDPVSDPAVEPSTANGLRTAGERAADYYRTTCGTGMRLLGSCDGTVPDPQAGPGGRRPHAQECAAQETGAFLYWLATVGQVFAASVTRADFQDAEDPASERSLERLARARQNFPLGPGYVRAVVEAARGAWDLHHTAAG